MAATHTQTDPSVFIKALASYFKQLPSHNGPAFKPQGVQTRGKLPNQAVIPHVHPSVQKPAGASVSALAYHMAGHSHISNGIQFKPGHPQTIHPGKALTLRAVKSVHLSTPHIPKVSA